VDPRADLDMVIRRKIPAPARIHTSHSVLSLVTVHVRITVDINHEGEVAMTNFNTLSWNSHTVFVHGPILSLKYTDRTLKKNSWP